MQKITSISIFKLCLLFIFSTAAFSGCKNEIDVNDEYHDIMVCYGILNPYDSVQYVRVDKVYLGDGNAIASAQYNDSISFSTGRLNVIMQQWNNGQLLNTYPMFLDTSIRRDSGFFSHPYQVLYKGTFPVLKDGSSYTVIVTDLLKGTSINATTNIPQDITMVNPFSTTSPLNLWDTTVLNFKFKTARYGYRYQMFLRFHYTEQFVFDTTQQSQKYVDWCFGEQDAYSDAGNDQLTISIVRHSFFNFLATTIPVDPMVRRVSGKIDLCFTGATTELATYIDVGIAMNNSLTSIPFYSNVNGGYGIFAARNSTFSLNYSLDQNTTYNIHLDPVMQPINFIR